MTAPDDQKPKRKFIHGGVADLRSDDDDGEVYRANTPGDTEGDTRKFVAASFKSGHYLTEDKQKRVQEAEEQKRRTESERQAQKQLIDELAEGT
jgi:hypothetical protein